MEKYKLNKFVKVICGISFFLVLTSFSFYCVNNKQNIKSECSYEKSISIGVEGTRENYNKLYVILNENQSSPEFQIDTIFGFIKMGDFWHDGNKYAVIINFDEETEFHILQFVDNKWNEIYLQKIEYFRRVYPIIPKFDDYNFDGIVDLAFHNGTSNGAAIKSYFLWLKLPDGFHYVDGFMTIGTPKILTEQKIIKSYTACCIFTNIDIMQYKWCENSLCLTDSCHIENYPYLQTKEHFKIENGVVHLLEKTDFVEADFAEKLIREFE